uniref:Protease n=1 Tax=viral metagenome TaxID=1070528 RepID=A0A6C0F922_9ZZZZ|tara:strand:- start:14421 stop:15017 length:597 start_codon:yes stop_codon:yes gene_type:complete
MYHLNNKQIKLNEDKEIDDNDLIKVCEVGNHIYFYSDVTRFNILKLLVILKEKTLSIKKKFIDNDSGTIFLHICSNGGSIHEGLAAMDTIKSNDIPVTTIIEGLVCSAASFIALGGKTVVMRPNAHLLIHQISSSFWGKYEDFNDEKQNLDKLMQLLKTLYTKTTIIPKEELDVMFKRDMYINAKQCLKWKIISKIIE